MAAVNCVILAGYLARDVEVRFSPGGAAVAHMRLGVYERFAGKDGQPAARATFVDVEAWDKMAESCGKYLRKKSAVLVEGRLQMSEWQDKSGQKRSKLFIRAHRVQFLDVGERDEGKDERPPRGTGAAEEAARQPGPDMEDEPPF